MADSSTVRSSSSAPSSAFQGSDRMSGTSTPQTEGPEPASQPKPVINDGFLPPRVPKTQQGPQNDPIQIPKITTDISFTEDPALLVRGLEGKCVDEFGNILDWDGTVQGRVQGDLPSMVGRSVSNDGRVRDEAGDLAGYVSENYLDSSEHCQAAGNTGLKIDHTGTIYDHNGEVVGKMKDHSKENNNANSTSNNNNNNDDDDDDDNDNDAAAGCARCRERERSAEGSKDTTAPRPEEKAEASTPNVPHRSSVPSPSEIYLDVKSTHDGIQLIIKIPTIFNRSHEDKR